MPATPPAVSSGESATLRLPLSIINGDVLQTHAAERPPFCWWRAANTRCRTPPRARLPCLFSIESRWAAWGKWKFGPPAGCLCAGLFAHIKQ